MPKKIPMRQCCGCREMKMKKELIRVVRAPDGTISIDARGKAPGRGVYLCPSEACLKRAQKTRGLERSLETSIPPQVYEMLAQQVKEYES